MKRAGLKPPDEALAVAAILGNLGAFDELVLRYRSAVVRLAESIVGREFAEDAAQDALLLAFKALPSIEDPSSFAAWLAAVTRNRALRFRHQEHVRESVRVELDDLLLERVSALNPPLTRDGSAEEEINRALENVPAEYALPLRLHYLDEMPLKRIAAFLSLPLSTVKWRVHNGRKLLRGQIELLRNRSEEWKQIKR